MTYVICQSLYHEDISTEPIEKNGHFTWTTRTVPRCKFESCVFTDKDLVWCPLQEALDFQWGDEKNEDIEN